MAIPCEMQQLLQYLLHCTLALSSLCYLSTLCPAHSCHLRFTCLAVAVRFWSSGCVTATADYSRPPAELYSFTWRSPWLQPDRRGSNHTYVFATVEDVDANVYDVPI